MAEFLTTSGTSYHIEKIIIGAEKNLVLVSPYLQISKTFYERLKDASKKKVEIKIIFGKNELNPNEKNALAELKNLTLYFFENLHAKCYFNEKEMVITSMNMYEFSEKNNREMGVFLTLKNDENIFHKAVRETLSIIESSEKIQLTQTSSEAGKHRIFNKISEIKEKPSEGYCIRCKGEIPYNTGKPYCWNCFSIWTQYENMDYKENVCHSCGELVPASRRSPECYECYMENRQHFTTNNDYR